MQRMYRCMLGGPFFTTVPSGRVGRNRGSAYFSNEAFVQGVRRSERDDQVCTTPRIQYWKYFSATGYLFIVVF